MKTFIPKVETLHKKWFLLDLNGMTLGHAAVAAANVLRGKNKAIFTPHLDTGDYLIAINATKLKLSGSKEGEKKYYNFSGYPGGLKVTPYRRMMQTKPEQVFERAVMGMLPKNRLGRKMFKKLHVYPGEAHPHQAQKPEPLK